MTEFEQRIHQHAAAQSGAGRAMNVSAPHLLSGIACLNVAVEEIRTSLVEQELPTGPRADLTIFYRKLAEAKGHIEELMRFWTANRVIPQEGK